MNGFNFEKKIKIMIKQVFHLVLLVVVLSSCMKGQKVDLIIHNAVIHSMDEKLTTYEAMAIKDGIIVELGPERQILNKYATEKSIDAGGKDIYPGFTDAHVHLVLGAKQRMGVDLSQSKSFNQLLMDVEIYQQRNHDKIIVGHGWNEGAWRISELPTNERLNELFPNVPVCLFRNDGHTALINDAMMRLAKISADHVFEGGELLLKDGKPTGIVTDAVMDRVKEFLPKYTLEQLEEKIIDIQNELLMYGITNVHDAGLELEEVKLFQKMIDQGRLKLNVYGMLLPTEENITFAKKNGIFEYKNLSIRSFKLFADGSLGGRGALLSQPYADDVHTSGHATVTQEQLTNMVQLCKDLSYQLNTHAIGDAAVKIVLEAYASVRDINPDHRWRIEHAQIINPADLPLFAQYGVFPSVQPSHAVSDYLFAEKRLGANRLQHAYAYQSLLANTGMMAIGTDFPIESMNPFKTIYAACARKNEKEEPHAGFHIGEALTLDDCLRGMTVWSAFAGFQEDRLGKLEVGMDATFAIFERKVSVGSYYQPNFSLHTFIKGVEVYSAE